jgi:hypothetical protein
VADLGFTVSQTGFGELSLAAWASCCPRGGCHSAGAAHNFFTKTLASFSAARRRSASSCWFWSNLSPMINGIKWMALRSRMTRELTAANLPTAKNTAARPARTQKRCQRLGCQPRLLSLVVQKLSNIRPRVELFAGIHVFSFDRAEANVTYV